MESVSTFENTVSDFLTVYAKFLVSYTCALFFLLYGAALFIEQAVPIPMQNILVFWGVALLLFGVSYVIRRDDIVHHKPILFVVWLGNVFGLLFNGMYTLVKIGATYGYPFSFGDIEKYLLYVAKHGDFNMIETMYAFIGGMLFILLLSLSVMYGLTLRDRFIKEGRKLMALLGGFVAIGSGFLFFVLVLLLIGYYKDVYWYLIYFITGSMLFIYTTNLFKKGSGFLKL